MMKRILLACAAAAVLCIPAEAQRLEQTLAAQAAFEPARDPVEQFDGAEPNLVAGTASLGPARIAPPAARRRNGVIGALVGTVAGAAYGIYSMSSTDDYFGMPPYWYTAPAGMLLGALIGSAIP